MANRRIVCITKHPTHQDRYHRITHVGVGTDADKASEKLDVATVIRNIKSVSGDSYYVVGSDGSEASVIVRSIAATATTSSPRRRTIRRKTTSWSFVNAVGNSSVNQVDAQPVTVGTALRRLTTARARIKEILDVERFFHV
jgi:hypothetical protein